MILGIDASNLRGGGGRTHIVELLRHADDVRQEISRIVVWGARDLLEHLPVAPWLSVRSDRMLDGGGAARMAWRLTRLPAASRRVDVVFAPGGLLPNGRTRGVVMCQNMLLFDTRQRRRWGHSPARVRLELLRRGHRASYRRARGIIFLSSHAQDVVRADLGGRIPRSAVVPHGIPAHWFRPPVPQRSVGDLTPQRPFRLVYVSAISAYKNHDAVVKAVMRLRRQFAVELVLVGAADSRRSQVDLVDTIRREGAEGVVTWRGDVRYEDVHEELCAADAFVFASSCENLPLALLEAMAAGLPIASSGTRPMTDILGDGAIFFDPSSAESIATALHRFVEDPAARARSARISYQKATAYTWRAAARETFRFISEVAR